jgi:hypothetical protein
MDLREQLSEFNEEMLFIDGGFDSAIIGIVERFGQDPIALYDKQKVIDLLMKPAGSKKRQMSYEEAIEYFEYNMAGAWLGEGTPAFATLTENS